jgi:integrase
MARLEQNCFAAIGAARLDTIKAPDILKLLRKVEERGAIETAYRVQNILCQVWDYGIACGCVEHNPARPLRKALASVKKRHLPALTDPVQVGAYMRAIDGYRGGEIVRGALMFGVLTFVRPGELRKALWSEIDTEHALWNIRAERMKMREAHTVPLSRQALEVLNELRIRTSNSEFIFPSPRSHKRPLSENGVLAALRTMGYDRDTMSGHGVRAMARTILDEQLHVPPALIEQQLAHVVRDPLGRAYNRTTHLPARKVLMQLWSDALEHLQSGNSIDSFDRQTYQV